MSTIKFSFEGDVHDLLRLLSGVKREGAPDRPVSCDDYAVGPRANPTQEALNRAVEKARAEARFPGPTLPPHSVEVEQYNKDPLSSAVPPMEGVGGGIVTAPGFDFDKVELNPEAWEFFRGVVQEWAVGFDAPLGEDGKPSVPQPDRKKLLESIGAGRWPIFILKWLAHHKCLQEAVYQALVEKDADLADAIAMNMVQIAHVSFPDIADFYDHSPRWRRSKK